ncbi:MAG: hypothetical protein LBL35_01255 [Clostridiales bacterium]|jgi:hypothetical protein|nr:hypothetical protein [Clostridiales bacterium]
METLDGTAEKVKKRRDIKRTVHHAGLTVLSFIFSILIAFTSFLTLSQVTILSEDFFRGQIEKSGYINFILNDIIDKLAAYGSVSGFGREFFEEAVSEKSVEPDVYREVSRLFTRGKKTINAAEFKEKLTAKLFEDVERRGLELTDEGQKAVNYLAEVSTAVYAQKLAIPLSDHIYGAVTNLKRLNAFALAIIVFLDILCLALLMFARTSRLRKAKYFLNSLNGALLMGLALTVTVSLSDMPSRLAISNQAIYYFIQTYVGSFLVACYISVAAVAVLSLSVLIFRIKLKRSKMTR